MSPNCQYFPQCGGCDFLNLETSEYQNQKQQLFPKLQFSDWIWIDQNSRRKITLQINAQNRLGFFSKKTNNLIEVESCVIAEKQISELILPLKNFLQKQQQNFFTSCTITAFDNGLDVIFSTKNEPEISQSRKLIDFAKEFNLNISCLIKGQISGVFLTRKNQIFYPNFKLDLDSGIFLQATKSGLAAIISEISNFLKNNPQIKNIADIYAGFGAYSFALVNLAKNISAFEGDKKMVDAINKNAALNNLSAKIKGEIRDVFKLPLTKKELERFDLIIMNPPRNGASPQALEIAKSKIKKLIYVSCNPQSFQRDCEILQSHGFAISKLTALDQFFATSHLELIAFFERS